MRVLVAEDEQQLASFIRKGLQEEGHVVDVVHDGDAALIMGRTSVYDAIVLDILLPGRSGFDVIRTLRREGVATPILCLTALERTEEKVAALDLGADDYMVKPFEFAELVARLRALERRPAGILGAELRCGDLTLDRLTRKVSRAGKPIDLTPREFALLEHLLRNVGRPVTRTSIIEHVWDMNFDSLTNVVDVFIKRLREKIDRPFGRPLLHTVRGVGYVLEEPEG